MEISTIWPNVIPGVTVAFFAALLTVGLGPWLASRWNFFLKQRELDLAAVHQFYGLYGEFFAVWKLWHSALRAAEKSAIKWQMKRAMSFCGVLAMLKADIKPCSPRRVLRGDCRPPTRRSWPGSGKPINACVSPLNVALDCEPRIRTMTGGGVPTKMVRAGALPTQDSKRCPSGWPPLSLSDPA